MRVEKRCQVINLLLSNALCMSLVTVATAASARSVTSLGCGAARSIGAGDGDYPWVVGTDPADDNGNNHLWYFTGSCSNSTPWVETNGSGTQIAAAFFQNDLPQRYNLPIVLNNAGYIYYGYILSDGSGGDDTSVSWTQFGGGACGTSISTDYGEANIYVTGCTANAYGNYDVYVNTTGPSGGWSTVGAGSGAGQIVATAPDDSGLWLVNNGTSGNVMQYVSGTWTQEGATNASAIAVGNSNTVYIVDTNGNLDQWNGSGWTLIASAGAAPLLSGQRYAQLSIGYASDTVWLLDNDNNIYTY
jgi:hypothetical protein